MIVEEPTLVEESTLGEEWRMVYWTLVQESSARVRGAGAGEVGTPDGRESANLLEDAPTRSNRRVAPALLQESEFT